MDFDAVVEELYAGSRSEFINRRGELAARARQDGDRSLADRITRLRKPTVAAWLVNRLAREDPAAIENLTALGEQLRAAHETLDGERLRALSRERQSTVRTLIERVGAIGEAAGQPVGSPVLDQVRATLEAALADADLTVDLADGRLESVPSASGAGLWTLSTAPTESTASKAEKTSVPETRARGTEGRTRGTGTRTRGTEGRTRGTETRTGGTGTRTRGTEGRTRGTEGRAGVVEQERVAQRRRRELERMAAKAERGREEAAVRLERAKRAAAEAKAHVRDLRGKLAAAEFRERKAADALASAEQDHAGAAKESDAARRALSDSSAPDS